MHVSPVPGYNVNFEILMFFLRVLFAFWATAALLGLCLGRQRKEEGGEA